MALEGGTLIMTRRMSFDFGCGEFHRDQRQQRLFIRRRAGAAATALAAAAKRATQALDSAKGAVGGANLDDLGSKAVAAASTLYRQGRELLSNSEEFTQAKEELSGAIKKILSRPSASPSPRASSLP